MVSRTWGYVAGRQITLILPDSGSVADVDKKRTDPISTVGLMSVLMVHVRRVRTRMHERVMPMLVYVGLAPGSSGPWAC